MAEHDPYAFLKEEVPETPHHYFERDELLAAIDHILANIDTGFIVIQKHPPAVHTKPTECELSLTGFSGAGDDISAASILMAMHDYRLVFEATDTGDERICP